MVGFDQLSLHRSGGYATSRPNVPEPAKLSQVIEKLRQRQPQLLESLIPETPRFPSQPPSFLLQTQPFEFQAGAIALKPRSFQFRTRSFESRTRSLPFRTRSLHPEMRSSRFQARRFKFRTQIFKLQAPFSEFKGTKSILVNRLHEGYWLGRGLGSGCRTI